MPKPHAGPHCVQCPVPRASSGSGGGVQSGERSSGTPPPLPRRGAPCARAAAVADKITAGVRACLAASALGRAALVPLSRSPCPAGLWIPMGWVRTPPSHTHTPWRRSAVCIAPIVKGSPESSPIGICRVDPGPEGGAPMSRGLVCARLSPNLHWPHQFCCLRFFLRYICPDVPPSRPPPLLPCPSCRCPPPFPQWWTRMRC
jgi:hypothetical protein